MKTRIAEFDWLKIFALFLLIFVHSDLYFVFPEVIYPIQWFLLSCFFFISGFLTFDSFHKCGASIRDFCKKKILLLYVPFAVTATFYFVLQVLNGAITADPSRLLSNVLLLNIFDDLNFIYNWGPLWFVPYLLIFMLIFCFITRYVEKAKIQIFIVSLVWFCTILTWVYDTPMKLGQVFSQYFLIFMIGVWFNKFRIYERAMKLETTCIAFLVIVLFSLDFSHMFTCKTPIETLWFLFYFHGRSIVFSVSAILLVLVLLRKMPFPHNFFVESVASTSLLIYLMEPFFSYVLRIFVFGKLTVYFADGAVFYLYQIARIAVLLGFLPLAIKTVKRQLPRMIRTGDQILRHFHVTKNESAAQDSNGK